MYFNAVSHSEGFILKMYDKTSIGDAQKNDISYRTRHYIKIIAKIKIPFLIMLIYAWHILTNFLVCYLTI